MEFSWFRQSVVLGLKLFEQWTKTKEFVASGIFILHVFCFFKSEVFSKLLASSFTVNHRRIFFVSIELFELWTETNETVAAEMSSVSLNQAKFFKIDTKRSYSKYNREMFHLYGL